MWINDTAVAGFVDFYYRRLMHYELKVWRKQTKSVISGHIALPSHKTHVRTVILHGRSFAGTVDCRFGHNGIAALMYDSLFLVDVDTRS